MSEEEKEMLDKVRELSKRMPRPEANFVMTLSNEVGTMAKIVLRSGAKERTRQELEAFNNHLKTELADLIYQSKLFAEFLRMDFDDLLEMGRERFKDFKP